MSSHTFPNSSIPYVGDGISVPLSVALTLRLRAHLAGSASAEGDDSATTPQSMLSNPRLLSPAFDDVVFAGLLGYCVAEVFCELASEACYDSVPGRVPVTALSRLQLQRGTYGGMEEFLYRRFDEGNRERSDDAWVLRQRSLIPAAVVAILQ